VLLRLPLNSGSSVFFRRRNPSLILQDSIPVSAAVTHALLTLPRLQAVIGCCSHDQPTTDRPISPKITHPLCKPTPRNDILHSTAKEAKEAHAKLNMFEYRYFPSIFDSLSMFTYLHVEIHRSTNRTPLTKNSPIFDPIHTFDRTSIPQFTKFSNPQNTRKK
jgi:hypothetical protein